MQHKIEILEGLTKEQRKEFEKDVQYLIERAGIEFNFDSQKVGKLTSNIRLKDEIFLHVTVLFHCDTHGHIKGTIEELTRFNTLDEYLDSINKANSDPKTQKIK